ncbi:UNVERIFIED_CONTAM: putative acetyltransferase [Acetivibrio alkalicellulosi]
MNNHSFRYAKEDDTKLVLMFLKELAKYENMEDKVVITEYTLRKWLFEENKVEVIFALKNSEEIGFALFFYTYSSFSGKAGLFIEDLFVKPEYRNKGYGKALIKKLASIAMEKGCQKLDWLCLDWNKPSIDFYLSLGAQPLNDWTKYQITDEALKDLVD